MIFANVVLRAKTVTKINNTKPNTFAFQFLTLARFSENRVASMMIPLLSRDGVDSIISKVGSSRGSLSIFFFILNGKNIDLATVKYQSFRQNIPLFNEKKKKEE